VRRDGHRRRDEDRDQGSQHQVLQLKAVQC
jgi:hypothetical protein